MASVLSCLACFSILTSPEKIGTTDAVKPESVMDPSESKSSVTHPVSSRISLLAVSAGNSWFLEAHEVSQVPMSLWHV